MPFLYGNKAQRVFAEGDDIEDIIPLGDTSGIVAEGEDGEIDKIIGPDVACEERAGDTDKTVAGEGAITKDLTVGLGTVTADSKLIQEKDGILVTDVIDDKAIAEGVEGATEKIVGEENVSPAVEGLIDTDVVDDKLLEEKEGTISTNLNIVENKCIKPS